MAELKEMRDGLEKQLSDANSALNARADELEIALEQLETAQVLCVCVDRVSIFHDSRSCISRGYYILLCSMLEMEFKTQKGYTRHWTAFSLRICLSLCATIT